MGRGTAASSASRIGGIGIGDFLVHLRLSVPGSPMLVAISKDAAAAGTLVYPQFPREHVHLFGNDGRRLKDRENTPS